MPIEPNQNVGISVSAARAIGAIDARTVLQSGGSSQKLKSQSAAPGMVETSQALDPGAAPVDTDRVAQIRKAIETNTYPLLPTKVADAIIAAGLMLRSPK